MRHFGCQAHICWSHRLHWLQGAPHAGAASMKHADVHLRNHSRFHDVAALAAFKAHVRSVIEYGSYTITHFCRLARMKHRFWMACIKDLNNVPLPLTLQYVSLPRLFGCASVKARFTQTYLTVMRSVLAGGSVVWWTDGWECARYLHQADIASSCWAPSGASWKWASGDCEEGLPGPFAITFKLSGNQ